MNAKMNNLLKGTGIFLLGLIAGIIAAESLESYLRPTYRRVIGTTLKVEEEFKAGRAARENRPVDAAFHRWAVVNLESEDGFGVFRAKDNNLDDNSLSFPLALLGLKWMGTPENVKKGEKILQGQERAKLALALEAIGQRDEAEKQWQYSKDLQPGRPVEAVKESARKLLESEKTDLYRQAEDAVLGKP